MDDANEVEIRKIEVFLDGDYKGRRNKHYTVLCPFCIGRVKVYPWSWAGHGFKICTTEGCGARLIWSDYTAERGCA